MAEKRSKGDNKGNDKPKNPLAQALVAIRWKNTPKKDRSAGARKAALARWAKEKT